MKAESDSFGEALAVLVPILLLIGAFLYFWSEELFAILRVLLKGDREA